jgi:hypothetical protein
MNKPLSLDMPPESRVEENDYLSCFRANGMRRFDWTLVDPALAVGSRIVVWHLAAPLLRQWANGAGAPCASPNQAGKRATVIDRMSAAQVSFMQRLYGLALACGNTPVVRVLFDDAPAGIDGQVPFSASEALPAALCLTLPHAQIPRAHERMTRFALGESVGDTAAREWMRFRVARSA